MPSLPNFGLFNVIFSALNYVNMFDLSNLLEIKWTQITFRLNYGGATFVRQSKVRPDVCATVRRDVCATAVKVDVCAT